MSKKIEDLKDLVAFVIDLGQCGYLMAEDGKLDLSDMGHFWEILTKAGPALSGIDNVPGELKDLDTEEIDELIKFVSECLELPSEKNKLAVEKILIALKTGYEAFQIIHEG